MELRPTQTLGQSPGKSVRGLDARVKMAGAGTSTKEFKFLSGLDTTYNREVRGFVLQSHIQKRRREAQKRVRNKLRIENEVVQRIPYNDPSGLVLDAGARHHLTKHHLQLVPITSFLGQGRIDPFGVYACKVNAKESFFLDQCGFETL